MVCTHINKCMVNDLREEKCNNPLHFYSLTVPLYYTMLLLVINVIASYFSTYTLSIMHDNFVLDGDVGAFGLQQHTYDSSKNNAAILTAITIQRHG